MITFLLQPTGSITLYSVDAQKLEHSFVTVLDATAAPMSSQFDTNDSGWSRADTDFLFRYFKVCITIRRISAPSPRNADFSQFLLGLQFITNSRFDWRVPSYIEVSFQAQWPSCTWQITHAEVSLFGDDPTILLLDFRQCHFPRTHHKWFWQPRSFSSCTKKKNNAAQMSFLLATPSRLDQNWYKRPSSRRNPNRTYHEQYSE